MRFLLDTNHVSAVLRGDEGLHRRMLEHGDEAFAVPTPALGELYYGALGGTKAATNLLKLRLLTSRLLVLPFDPADAERYGVIAAHLRRMGRPIPVIDIQVAAIAMGSDLCVLSADRHFSYIPNLKVENWLEPSEPDF